MSGDMSGDRHPAGQGDDGPGIDPRLRAALDHAPDGELRPPPAVRAAVLQAAHGVHRQPAAPLRGWRRWWAAAMAPRTLATAASVACVGIALKLAWPEPEWSRQEGPEDRPAAAVQPMPPPEATAHSRAAPPPPAAEAAAPPPRADVPPPPADRAPAPAPSQRERTGPRPVPAPAPPAPAPTITTTAEPPPAPPAPAPVTAAAPPTAAIAPLPRAEPVEPAEQRAAKALAADAHDGARRGLAEASPAPALAKPAPPAVAAPHGHPAALARWAQALAAPAVDDTAAPAGWVVQRAGAPAAWGPAARAWWQVLLAGTAGRWRLEASAPADGEPWQLRAPDGALLVLRVGPDTLWLAGEGGTWRAPRPAALPPTP